MAENYADCLGELAPPTLQKLRGSIKTFIEEVKHVRSVDGFLIKLGFLAEEIKSSLSLNERTLEKEREMFKKVLECREVAEALSPLASYYQAVGDLIANDPRHRDLKPLADILLEHLEKASPSNKPLQLVREPIQVLERTSREEKSHQETIAREKVTMSSSPTRRMRISIGQRRKLLFAALVVAFLVLLLVLIVLTSQPSIE